MTCSPDMHRSLDAIYSSMDDQSYRLQELQAHSVNLGQDLELEGSSAPSPSEDPALGTLKLELQSRLQQGNELAALLMEKEKELQAVTAMLEVGGFFSAAIHDMKCSNLMHTLHGRGADHFSCSVLEYPPLAKVCTTVPPEGDILINLCFCG